MQFSSKISIGISLLFSRNMSQLCLLSNWKRMYLLRLIMTKYVFACLWFMSLWWMWASVLLSSLCLYFIFPCIALYLCDYPYVFHPNTYCTTPYVWPSQVSSTTLSVCLLLRRGLQRRTLQNWMEPKWSALSVQRNPGNPPIITALVRYTA